jgi:hypothetical protein
VNEVRIIEKIDDRFWVGEANPEPYQCSNPNCTDCGGVASIWLFDLALKARVPFESVEAARIHVSGAVLGGGTMTRDEARARLRELLEPIRIMAEMEFTVPDFQDAIRLLLVHEENFDVSEARRKVLEAVVSQAGYDLLTPLGYLFSEDTETDS